MRQLTDQEQKTLEDQFTYHAPEFPEQHRAYAEIRAAGKNLAAAILAHTPPCADASAAVRKVREAVMTANAAVSLDALAYAPGGPLAGGEG